MRKCLFWLCGVMAVLFLIPAEGLCDGFGFYSWGRGWPSIGIPGALEDEVPLFKGLEVDLRHDHFTFGYLYDGASTPEDRFGWRFNFGVDIVLTDVQGTNAPSEFVLGLEQLFSEIYDATGYGFAAKLAYGIGIVRKDRLRVWAGPSLRFNADYIDLKKASYQEELFDVLVEVDPWGIIFSLGGGVEAGIRYDVSRELSLDFSTGFHYNFFGSYQDLNLTVNGQSLGSDESFLSGEEPFFFVQIGLGFDFAQDKDSP